MPKQKRIQSDYPGVFHIKGTGIGGKSERIYYIMYRKEGKKIEEKAGRQYKNGMTAARANQIRSRRMSGKSKTNAELREARGAKLSAEANKWTINRLFESYKDNRPNLKDLKNDQNRFNNYIKPYFGDKEPSDILSLDVKRLEKKLLEDKSPGTVRNVLELLRRTINFGVKNQLCQGIGFQIEMPKVNNIKTEDLSTNQLKRLLEAIEKDTHPQAGTLMKMALFTGMRRGELFKLKWNHINYERGFIDIVDPKGGPDQKIPLNDAARELLQSHPKTESQFVFPGRGGNQRTDINKAVNAIKSAAGLPATFRPLHGLRHAFASALASSGQVDLYQIQRLLTHKSPIMTARYAHLRNERLRKASEVMSEIIANSQKTVNSEILEK